MRETKRAAVGWSFSSGDVIGAASVETVVLLRREGAPASLAKLAEQRGLRQVCSQGVVMRGLESRGLVLRVEPEYTGRRGGPATRWCLSPTGHVVAEQALRGRTAPDAGQTLRGVPPLETWY